MQKKLGGILSILLLTVALGFAQGTGSGGSDAATTPNQATNQSNGTQDNRGGHDWGWLGLLGLIGLAGLRRNRRDSEMTERDRNVSDIRRAA